MKLKKRFLILGALSLLFIIIAPLTLIFTLGYRFDFSQWHFVETGTLMIRSEPKGAEIFLNGRKIEQKTPTVIRFLFPGEYELEIKKENYKSWRKRLTILSEQVTLASPDNDPIYLFLNEPQIKSLSSSILDFFDNDGQIITVAGPQISFENFQTKTFFKTDLPFDAAANPRIEISPDNNWAFIRQSPNTLTALSLNTEELVDLTSLLPEISDVQSFGKTDLLFLDNRGVLYNFNAETKILVQKKRKVSAFLASDNQFFYINSSSLYLSNKASTTVEMLASGFPSFSQGEIISTSSGRYFALLDGNLYSAAAGVSVLHPDVEQVVWDEKSKTLLFNNRHSIWIYDPQTAKVPELIIRSESPVANVRLNFQTNRVFFLQNNTIKAVETKAKISRDVSDLIRSESPIAKFYPDAAGGTLFYLEKNGDLKEAKIR